jgi:hypothetical protein
MERVPAQGIPSIVATVLGGSPSLLESSPRSPASAAVDLSRDNPARRTPNHETIRRAMNLACCPFHRIRVAQAAIFAVVPWVIVALLVTTPASADPDTAYRTAMALAAEGDDGEAVARLLGALDALPEGPAAGEWRGWLASAAALLDMRRDLRLQPAFTVSAATVARVQAYLATAPPPERGRPWVAGLLGAVFPGVGHAWLGRWHDGVRAAALVWPMLLLTLWAWRRRMGPVTVFFAAITLWLWSGTVFSAYSLARRGDLHAYLAWWQGVWQASGLPGRPW